MSLTRHTLLIALFLLFAIPSFADTGTNIKTDINSKTYLIGTYKVPTMVTSTDNGVFVELFKEAAKRAGIKYKIEMYPSKRAVHYFQTGEIDGFFPAFDESAGDNAAKSESIHVKNNVVFVRKNSEFINSVDQLAGKIVGLTRGYHYDNRIFENPDIKIEYAPSVLVNIQKLSAGRIDAFVAEDETGLKALKESKITNIHYDPNSTLFSKKVFIAFHGDKEGQAINKKISKALIEMKKDGTYQKIKSVLSSTKKPTANTNIKTKPKNQKDNKEHE